MVAVRPRCSLPKMVAVELPLDEVGAPDGLSVRPGPMMGPEARTGGDRS
jgi:hypothetical protein